MDVRSLRSEIECRNLLLEGRGGHGECLVRMRSSSCGVVYAYLQRLKGKKCVSTLRDALARSMETENIRVRVHLSLNRNFEIALKGTAA